MGKSSDKRKQVRLSKLALIDLAGSERASSTGATGARLKEGANINKSLSTLGRCISTLAKISAATGSRQTHSQAAGSSSSLLQPPKPSAPIVPFRESILTWLLRESLCGNAKTSMLATISPAQMYLSETVSTLRYAYSAKQISTQAVVNEDPTSKIIKELRQEVTRLQEVLKLSSSTEKAKHNDKLRMSLSNAETALHAYENTNDTENQRQSMRNVKRNLLNRQLSTFGTEDMSDGTDNSAPYLVFLSNDPQLNLAVKVYIPAGKKLKLGKAVSENADDDDSVLDLQIDGLGIEDLHSVLSHDDRCGSVTLNIVDQALTYHNGVPLVYSGDAPELINSDFMLRNNSGSLEGESHGVTGDVYRRSPRTSFGKRKHYPDTDSMLSIGDGAYSRNDYSTYPMSSTPRDAVEIHAGDRIVLGECSHVFVFVTAEYAEKVQHMYYCPAITCFKI